MRVIRLAVVLFASLFVISGFAQSEGFFRCSGTSLLDPDNNEFLIRGNALSHWNNAEGYALKLTSVHWRHMGSDSSIRSRIRDIVGEANANRFWSTYGSNFVTAADIADLKAEGFNTIRLPFNYRLVSPAATPGVYSEEGFAALDQIIAWCKTNDLYVILDMHACPGGQSHDSPADPEWAYWYWNAGVTNWLETGVACLWVSNADYYAASGRTPAFNKQRTADIWQEIASRYADEPAIIGYELINEPVLPDGVTSNDLRALLIQITDAIRAVDTNHTIFVQGGYYGSSLDGLVPPWDDNMVLCFHKYWEPTAVSSIQAYINASTQYDVPVLMSESGENSNPWFFDFVNTLESNDIGWIWWGFKKIDLISSAFSAFVTPDYQYVINNFRDSPIDGTQAFKGLMECATNMQSALCAFDPGWYGALFSADFGTTPQPFVNVSLPGRIQAVNYDIGNNGVAYYDARAKNEDGLYGAPYNNGYKYRNDGVDIYANSDPQSIGFHVGATDNGEWLKYTVNVQTTDNYRTSFRVATSGGQIRLFDGSNALTGPITITNTGGYGSWKTQTNNNPASLSAGTHVLTLSVIAGGVDIAWVDFALIPPLVASAPTCNPNGGTFTNSVSVILASATGGSTIHYTTDGTTPTTNSASIASGSSIALTQPYTNSVRAFATASGHLDSSISTSAVFVVVPMSAAAAPTYSPNGGTFSNGVAVTLTSTTPGASIYYTTNGTAPTTNSAYVASGSAITLSRPYTNSVRAFAKATGYLDSSISTSAVFTVVSAPLVLLNGALTGSGTQPTNWLNWGDANHDPNTTTYRSAPNSWAFWYDGGLYQDITNGFTVGQTITFGGYMRHPSTDALRSGTKYGIIQLEFRTAADVLISTASTAQINKNSAKNTWLSFQSTGVVPANTAKVRLVVRCNNFTSGAGRFFADDLYVQ